MPKPWQQEEKDIITLPGFSGWIPLLGGVFCRIIHQLIYGPHTMSNNPPRAPQLKGPERCHIPAERASSLGNCLWNAPTGSTAPIDQGTLSLSKKVLKSWTLMEREERKLQWISEVRVTQENMQFIHASTTCPLHALIHISSLWMWETNTVEPSRFIFKHF